MQQSPIGEACGIIRDLMNRYNPRRVYRRFTPLSLKANIYYISDSFVQKALARDSWRSELGYFFSNYLTQG